jgi:Cupredoxin-like domain
MPAQMIRIMVRSMPAVPRHRPDRLALLGVLAAALCLSACTAHVVNVNSSEVRLRLDEFRITPQTVQVHAAPRIKISATNVGVETHDLVVESEYLLKSGEPVKYNVAEIAKPGQTISFKLNNLKPGDYKLVDTVANHADLGDYGTLIVLK